MITRLPPFSGTLKKMPERGVREKILAVIRMRIIDQRGQWIWKKEGRRTN